MQSVHACAVQTHFLHFWSLGQNSRQMTSKSFPKCTQMLPKGTPKWHKTFKKAIWKHVRNRIEISWQKIQNISPKGPQKAPQKDTKIRRPSVERNSEPVEGGLPPPFPLLLDPSPARWQKARKNTYKSQKWAFCTCFLAPPRPIWGSFWTWVKSFGQTKLVPQVVWPNTAFRQYVLSFMLNKLK